MSKYTNKVTLGVHQYSPKLFKCCFHVHGHCSYCTMFYDFHYTLYNEKSKSLTTWTYFNVNMVYYHGNSILFAFIKLFSKTFTEMTFQVLRCDKFIIHYPYYFLCFIISTNYYIEGVYDLPWPTIINSKRNSLYINNIYSSVFPRIIYFFV